MLMMVPARAYPGIAPEARVFAETLDHERCDEMI
jgi:hypothetical protein